MIKNIFFVIKVGIISVVLYYLLLVFIIQPFIIGTLFQQSIFQGNFYMYIYNIIYILLFVGVCWGVTFFLKKPIKRTDVVATHENISSSGETEIKTYIWVFALSLITIIVPQLSSQQMSQMVYIFTIPLAIICWIIFNLMQTRYKNTGNKGTRNSIYILLTVWTLVIAFIYQQLF